MKTRMIRKFGFLPLIKFAKSLALVLLMLGSFFIPIYGSMIFNKSDSSLLSSIVIFLAFFYVMSKIFKSTASTN